MGNRPSPAGLIAVAVAVVAAGAGTRLVADATSSARCIDGLSVARAVTTADAVGGLLTSAPSASPAASPDGSPAGAAGASPDGSPAGAAGASPADATGADTEEREWGGRIAHPVEPLADDPFEAAQLGIDWLTFALCEWMQTTGVTAPDCTTGEVETCMGCHVQGAPLLGLARSTNRCYTVPWTSCADAADETAVDFGARFLAGAQRKPCIQAPFNPACGTPASDLNTLDGWPPWLGSIGHFPPCGSNAPPASVHPVMQTAHGALALVGHVEFVSPTYAPNLVALADFLPTFQQVDGSWQPDRFEAPVDQGAAFTTSSAAMALTAARPHGGVAQVASWDASHAAAIAWLRGAPLTTTQDQTFALLAFVDAGLAASDPDVVRVRDLLLGRQLADGGWAERDGLESNAYATGQAVNALIEAGVPLDDPALCAGIDWLVSRQDIDGWWNLGTPGVHTDATRNSRFTATIWPVLALGALSPFGGRLSVPDGLHETCDDEAVFRVELTHAADTACGLFARPDTFELSVANLDGDDAWVEPATVEVTSGGTATVEVHWRRVASSPLPGSMSTTRLFAESIGGRDAGCPVTAEAELVVRVPPDEDAPALGNGLRLTRTGPDRANLSFRWEALPRASGPHELVSVSWRSRERRDVEPSRVALDSEPPRARVAPSAARLSLAGESTPRGRGLAFYKVRATSPCEERRGPTCGIDCTDARRCDGQCP